MTSLLLGVPFPQVILRLSCHSWQGSLFVDTLFIMLNVLTLPFPPSSNTYYRSVRMGKSCRVLLSKKGRLYKEEVCEYIANQILDSKEFPYPLLGRLSVHVMLHAPNRRKWDIDNRIKPLLDAMQSAGVYPDDEAIDHLTIKRGEIIKGGKVTVQLIELKSKEET